MPDLLTARLSHRPIAIAIPQRAYTVAVRAYSWTTRVHRAHHTAIPRRVSHRQTSAAYGAGIVLHTALPVRIVLQYHPRQIVCYLQSVVSGAAIPASQTVVRALHAQALLLKQIAPQLQYWDAYGNKIVAYWDQFHQRFLACLPRIVHFIGTLTKRSIIPTR